MIKEILTRVFGIMGYRVISKSAHLSFIYKENMVGLFERYIATLGDKELSESEKKINFKFCSYVLENKNLTSSQLYQDLAFLFFCGRPSKNGYFVEVGVGDGVNHSNNLMLEKVYLMKGLLIEPDPRQKKSIFKNRTATYVGMAASSSMQSLKFNLASTPELSWTGAKPIDVLDRRALSVQEVSAKPLNDILNTHLPSGHTLDFLSFDVEGSEMDVLSGFNIEFWRPKFVCVEHNYDEQVKIDLVNYFSKGYNLMLRDISGCDYWFVRKNVIDL